MILDMKKFDIILGISWLSSYHVILDCYAKTITVAIPRMKKLEWEGIFKPTPVRIVSVVHAQKLVT